MKKVIRKVCVLMLAAVLSGLCGTLMSCKSSSETMYGSKQKTSKKINRNYKVRGNNARNSSTYRSY